MKKKIMNNSECFMLNMSSEEFVDLVIRAESVIPVIMRLTIDKIFGKKNILFEPINTAISSWLM